MIGTYNYVLYTNDTVFLMKNWPGYLKAMDFIYGKVTSTGLLNVTGIRDWARWQQGFNNSEANMMFVSLPTVFEAKFYLCVTSTNTIIASIEHS